MFSKEEDKILEKIFFQEFLNLVNLDFFNLLILNFLLSGYKNNEIILKLKISERGYFKRKKKLLKILKCEYENLY